jgi:hypothetical protein
MIRVRKYPSWAMAAAPGPSSTWRDGFATSQLTSAQPGGICVAAASSHHHSGFGAEREETAFVTMPGGSG